MTRIKKNCCLLVRLEVIDSKNQSVIYRPFCIFKLCTFYVYKLCYLALLHLITRLFATIQENVLDESCMLLCFCLSDLMMNLRRIAKVV